MIKLPPASHLLRRHRVLTWTVASLFLLFLAIRFIGSPVATMLANRKLAGLPDYTGKVGGVQLALWRGTVVIQDLELRLRKEPDAEPVLRVGHASLSLALGPLFRGKVGGSGLIEDTDVVVSPEVVPDEPRLSDEEKARKRKQRAEDARRWQATLREAFPMELSCFEIRHLNVRFKDRGTEPPVEIGMEEVHLVLTGVRNRPKDDDPTPAHLNVDARFTGGGLLHVAAAADPLARPPRFTTRMEIRDLALPPLNSFMMAYADVTVTKGTFEVFAEISADGGGYRGYLKPFFKDLEFKPVPDTNLARRVVVSVAHGVTHLLKNDEENVATKIPFEGNFENTEVDVWTTIENVLRNAFIQALREGLERQ